MVSNFFKNKTVLVTGHTGFKGSWLSCWLLQLGANVVGISLNPPTSPSLFDVLKLQNKMVDHRADIRDQTKLVGLIKDAKPDYLFHLAAQPIVGRSYDDPLETFQTNILGTANILECLRLIERACVAVIITSDKCYENLEWIWGYRETDRLGGNDPYSASKSAAELIIKSYNSSFFNLQNNLNIRIVSARAGNVIGGGDWAEGRIVPDCIKSWANHKVVELRNPMSTRPWQHVLEPLSGYLQLACLLSKNKNLHAESFNFGPSALQDKTVISLVGEISSYWRDARFKDISNSHAPSHEAGLLKLNCDKSLSILKWRSILNFEETAQMTAEWYKSFEMDTSSIGDFTIQQIENYTVKGRKEKIQWAI